MPKFLMLFGVIIFVAGAWMAWGPPIPYLGKFPGDIVVRKGPVTFYFPIVTCVILSLLVTVLLRWFNR